MHAFNPDLLKWFYKKDKNPRSWAQIEKSNTDSIYYVKAIRNIKKYEYLTLPQQKFFAEKLLHKGTTIYLSIYDMKLIRLPEYPNENNVKFIKMSVING